MHHFFVEPAQIRAESVELAGSDVNHIKNVLRMKQGEEIRVSDGFGNEYLCRIDGVEDASVRARILEKREVRAELSSRITLFQCLPKGDKMEWIVQKAVELGAASIVPVASHRCVARLDARKEESRRKRWNAIAKSAAKQSGRGMLPQVQPLADFSGALEQAKELDVFLFPYECAQELLLDGQETAMQKTRKILSDIQKGQSVGILIGPEGGFEKAEASCAIEAGAKPVSLGRRILRAETAGPCILSVLMFLMEE